MERLLTAREVADALGITTASLAQMRYLGRGPQYIKLNSRAVRYREAAITDWLSALAEDRGGR